MTAEMLLAYSALNIFDEFSTINPDLLAEYFGFTEEEFLQLCEKYHKNYQEIQYWYDGYCLNGTLSIYNPKSVVDSMQRLKLRSFWTSTETYEALQIYIDLS